MHIRWGRAIVAVLIAEIAGVLLLAIIVAAFAGTHGFEDSLPFANRVGAWVGPISGLVFMVLGGWWTAKAAPSGDRLRNGVAVGVLGAMLDFVLAGILGAGLVWLLILSNVLRVIGGAIGGWLAERRTNPSVESSPADSSPAI